jgi:hypothetical protein
MPTTTSPSTNIFVTMTGENFKKAAFAARVLTPRRPLTHWQNFPCLNGSKPFSIGSENARLLSVAK